jgi:hypothetical protein
VHEPEPIFELDDRLVKLSEMRLERARPYGNCWLGCELRRQLQLDRFWSGKLPQRESRVAAGAGTVGGESADANRSLFTLA